MGGSRRRTIALVTTTEKQSVRLLPNIIHGEVPASSAGGHADVRAAAPRPGLEAAYSWKRHYWLASYPGVMIFV